MRCSRPLIVFVALCWTLFSSSLSFHPVPSQGAVSRAFLNVQIQQLVSPPVLLPPWTGASLQTFPEWGSWAWIHTAPLEAASCRGQQQCWAQRAQSCANTELLLPAQSAWPQLGSTGRNWKWSTIAWPDQAMPCPCRSPTALLKLQKLSMDPALKSNPGHLLTHSSQGLVPKNFRVVPTLEYNSE